MFYMTIIIAAYAAISKCISNVKYELMNFESYMDFKIQKSI